MEQPSLFDLDEYTVDLPKAEHSNVFAKYLGAEAAAAISEALGGFHLRVPLEESNEEYKRMLEKLGPELTERFVRLFGGEVVYIPLNHQAKVNARHTEIRERVPTLVRQGKSRTRAIQTAAQEFEFSERHIRRILS